MKKNSEKEISRGNEIMKFYSLYFDILNTVRRRIFICDGSYPHTRPNPEAEQDPGRGPLFESNSFFFCQ